MQAGGGGGICTYIYRVRYMLDRGVPTLPGSMKAPDRGLYIIRYIHIQNTNIPGPVHAGPWCAYTSGFGESFGPWLKHIDIYITLIYRVQYMLDRGVHTLP